MRQYRPALEAFTWELPAGLVDPGEDPAETCRRELMEETDFSKYGRASKNPRCQDCMVHCGFEPSAVNATFGSARGMGATIASMVTGQL